jgi:hypothetical protein
MHPPGRWAAIGRTTPKRCSGLPRRIVLGVTGQKHSPSHQFPTIVGAQRRWAKRTQLFDKRSKLMDQLRRFGRRDPTGLKARLIDAAELKHLFEDGDPLLGGQITIQVITFAQASAADEHTIHPALKGQKNVVRRNPTTAHHPNGTNIRRVLQTTDPSQVSSGICSPGAQEADDLGLKIVVGHFLFLFLREIRWPGSGPATVPVYIP